MSDQTKAPLTAKQWEWLARGLYTDKMMVAGRVVRCDSLPPFEELMDIARSQPDHLIPDKQT